MPCLAPRAAPHLTWDAAPEAPAAVVLLLPGGMVASTAPMGRFNLAAARMIPFAWRIARAGRGRLAVARLRYRVRGWNGDDADPLVDARRALEEIRGRWHGIPIILVGHSMGGRIALRLADAPGITAAVALAPWIDRSDEPRGGSGRSVLLMHGTADVITSPDATAAYAVLLRNRGVDVTLDLVRWSLHVMVPRAGHWYRRVVRFVIEVAGA